MTQEIVLTLKIKRQQIQGSVDTLPRSVGGLLCDTGQLISSHHLCTLSTFSLFDTCCSWTVSYFLLVQNIAQSSCHCSINISEKKERSVFLWLLFSVSIPC